MFQVLAVKNPYNNDSDVKSPQIIDECYTYSEAKAVIREVVGNMFWCYGIMKKEIEENE